MWEQAVDRRYFLTGAACTLLGACSSISGMGSLAYSPGEANGTLVATSNEPHSIKPVSLSAIPAQYQRQIVRNPTGEPPGTIVVDPGQKYLYLVMNDGRARRYGIGVGRQGFGWSGTATIQLKRKWPKWYPPVEIQERDPRAKQYANGMEGGSDNPLGARAMYLFQDGKDTLYRIHGTAEERSIGHNVSSGCIRMLNVDVIDLYDRVPVGTRVVVRSAANPFERISDAISGPAESWGNGLRRLMGMPPA
jgi:lipoprotein-anchoring transpeptidase ErfK/SrfK